MTTSSELTDLQSALRRLISSFTLSTKTVFFTCDPAGRTREYVPDLADLSVLSVLAGREVAESELWLHVGGYTPDHYCVLEPLAREIACRLSPDAAEQRTDPAAVLEQAERWVW